MSGSALQFSLGLDAGGFINSVAASKSSLGAFSEKTNLASGVMRHMGEETLDTRERVEIFRNSLESMGGTFGMLADYSRMFLNPLTLGFGGAAFAIGEYLKKTLEEDGQAMRSFIESTRGVDKIMEGIIGARPSSQDQWVHQLETVSKIAEKLDDVKSLGDAFNEVLKGQDENNGEAATKQIEVEQKKIELLRQQGQISAADAAKRTEALKDQLVLQKNLNERTALQHEISRRTAELKHVQTEASKIPSPAGAALAQTAADAKVTDLKNQLDGLTKAIALNEGLISQATAKAHRTKGVPGKGEWYGQAGQLTGQNDLMKDQLARVKAQLPGAIQAASDANVQKGNSEAYKGRATELTSMINSLKNQLGVAVDRQRKMTPLQLQENHLDSLKSSTEHSSYKWSDSATALEKMGFSGNGGASLGRAYQQQTADGIRTLVGLTTTMVTLLSNNPGDTNSI